MKTFAVFSWCFIFYAFKGGNENTEMFTLDLLNNQYVLTI